MVNRSVTWADWDEELLAHRQISTWVSPASTWARSTAYWRTERSNGRASSFCVTFLPA